MKPIPKAVRGPGGKKGRKKKKNKEAALVE